MFMRMGGCLRNYFVVNGENDDKSSADNALANELKFTKINYICRILFFLVM